MASASEFMGGFSSRHGRKAKRTNWRLELKKERNKVLDEAIERIREKLRSEMLPEQFKRGHYAAITELELMRDEKK